MNVKEASELLLLIGDETRLTIVKALTKKLHMNAKDFLPLVSCKQATLSHHLTELVDNGLVKAKKSGNKVLYSLDARKFDALINFVGNIDRVNKKEEAPVAPAPVKEVKPVEKPIRVVDTPVVKKVEEKKGNPVKVELPTFLL